MKQLRKSWILSFLVIIVLVSFAYLNDDQVEVSEQRKAAGDTYSKLASSADDIPYVNLKMHFQTTPLTDYNADNVNEVTLESLSLNKDSIEQIIEVKGGYLVGSLIDVKVEESKHLQEYCKPILTRIDDFGKVVWQKTTDIVLYKGSFNHLYQLENGQIIISFSSKHRYHAAYVNVEPNKSQVKHLETGKSFLMKLNDKGEELWLKRLNDTLESSIQFIFLPKDNEVFTVGVSPGRDILVTKFGDTGEIIKQKRFGGSSYDNLHHADYNEKIGLVLMGVSQSIDGDFHITKLKNEGYSAPDFDLNDSNSWVMKNGEIKLLHKCNNRYFTACLDTDLNTNWLRVNELEEVHYSNLIVTDKSIHIISNKTENNVSTGDGVLERLSQNGDIELHNDEFLVNAYCKDHVQLLNGDMVLRCGNGDDSYLYVLDSSGNEKKRVDIPNYFSFSSHKSSGMYLANDGGYIVRSTRDLKTIPQPALSSQIWTDVEVIVEKYSSEHELVWRKSYDSYHDSTEIDFVQPFASSKILIE